ncbi:amidohydrolase family protein [Phytoactinopolyspora alkaliphila]|uniref:Amidohydrolase family protein n=1 Tax=Phytoactinopolyspora alkaliphila TaxID=1783498 RepID=A0A6N9YTA5_9ACTN|nr:amidohydrolase family protein [Phytoactinopolyspora alkaliphila]NED98180.1 amidohydrolase family protein [Phytoactinopolyspora alkaliphila]
MTVIDAHHHLWDPAARRYSFLERAAMESIRRPYQLDDLRRVCAAAGIDHTILVQTVATVEETAEFLRVAAGSEGLIAGVVGWVDLTGPAVADAIAALRALPGGDRLVGIRHAVQGERDPDWLIRHDVLDGLRAVNEAGLVFDLLISAEQLPAAISAVRRLPAGRFVLDHAGKPPIAAGTIRPWAAHLEELAQHPGVCCKLSGLVTEAGWKTWSIDGLRPYAETMFRSFGADRVMFGTDWPVCELAADHGRVVTTARRLTEEFAPGQISAVFGGTAIRRYALPLT